MRDRQALAVAGRAGTAPGRSRRRRARRIAALQSWRSHQTRSPAWTRTDAAPLEPSIAVDEEEPVDGLDRRLPAETPLTDCTKPPPKRVATLALRCSSRMTVSSPSVCGVAPSAPRRACRSPSVTVRRDARGDSPAPRPQPAAAVASAARSARRWRSSRRRTRPGCGFARAGRRRCPRRRSLEVEHVAAAAERLGQQVGPVGLGADREPRAAPRAAALHVRRTAARAAERRAAARRRCGQAQLHVLQARRVGSLVPCELARAVALAEVLVLGDRLDEAVRRLLVGVPQRPSSPLWTHGGRRRRRCCVVAAGRRRRRRARRPRSVALRMLPSCVARSPVARVQRDRSDAVGVRWSRRRQRRPAPAGDRRAA